MESAASTHSLVSRGERWLRRTADIPQRLVVMPLARALPQWVTPNLLSGVRLVLAAVVAALLLTGWTGAAVLVYLLAMGTDALDGGVARLRGRSTPFGARLDPSVDKVLQAVVFVVFLPVAPVLLGALLGFDLLLFVLGLLLALRVRRPADFSASMFGKWKLTLQVIASLALFWNVLLPSLAVPFPVIAFLLGAALTFAALSAVHYVQRWSAALWVA